MKDQQNPDFHEIKLLRKGLVCTLVLNRPEKRNTLSIRMLEELRTALGILEAENKIRCLILRGSGEKAFSSGYDIQAIQAKDMLRDFQEYHPLEACMRNLESFPYPTIAMMQGHSFGAGLELAVNCDLRICSDNIKIAMPPAKLGVAYSYSGIQKFLNLIGPAYTKELFLIGESITAQRALAIGLVNYAVSPLEIESFTEKLAQNISENAPLSLKAIKQLIHTWETKTHMHAKDASALQEILQKVEQSSDYQEGAKAFREKRKPLFFGQ